MHQALFNFMALQLHLLLIKVTMLILTFGVRSQDQE